jgi:tetratricopeptide (TPR) repeat protein
VLLLGLDGADWERIDPLVAAGKLPAFASLRREGATGVLLSEDPMLSPILWTSIATGRRPEDHGIVSFLSRDEEGNMIPVTSRQVRVPSLWHMVSEQGLSAGVIGWYATWPADELSGFVLSDRISAGQVSGGVEAPSEGVASPGELMATLREESARSARGLDGELLSFFRLEPEGARGASATTLDAGLLEAFGVLHAAARLHVALALRLWSERPTDLLAVYLEVPDGVYHLFAGYEPPRREGVEEELYERYREVDERYLVYLDRVLASFLERLGPADTLLVVSDHGFRHGESRPSGSSRAGSGHAPAWHRREGLFALTGAGAGRGVRLEAPVRLYDVAPTVLHLLGLPVARDFAGEVVERALSGEIRSRAVALVDSYGARERHAPEGPGLPEDPSARERIELLRSLGYLAAEDDPGGAAAGTLQEVYNRGLVLLFSGDLEGAEFAFLEVESLAPGSGISQVGLGEVALRRGDPAGARDFFEAAAAAMPAAPLPRVNGGLARLALGDLSGAERCFRDALSLDEGLFHAHRGLGEVALRRGEPAAALGHLERAERLAADAAQRADAAYLAGAALLQLGRPEEAARRWSLCLEHRPDHPEALFRLADLAMRGGRPAEAAELMGRLVRLAPERPEFRRYWAEALRAAGREDEASGALQGTLEPPAP